MPCFDSVKTYIIERSDPYVTFEFAYSLVPDGPIPPTEVPSGMIEIFPAGSTQPDSIRVHFADKGIDIRFTNIQSTACPLLSGSEGKSYRIKPDTTPTIDFSVTPVDVLACMGDTLKFVAKLNETVGFEASFEWHLPTQNPSVMLRPWRTVGITGEKRDTIRLVAAEYLDGLSSVDTLRVFASGSCGTTRNPEIARIRVEAAPVYHINIQSDHDQFRPGTIRQICENETLKVWADTLGLGLNFLSVRWDYPNSPNVEGNDTLNLTIPAGSFTLHARFYAAGTCGYSTPTSSLRVMVDNLPAVPQSRYAPWPCKEDDFEMNTLRDYWTDSIVWEWDENFNGSMPPDFFVVETSQNGLPSVTGSPTKNDSLYFKNVGISPFRLIATGWNHCGPRQDTILFTPSDSITPIPTDAFANFGSLRFCSGNEVVGALKIPFQHTNTRPNYIWTFNEDWTLVKDSINKADETLMVWFIPGTSAGTMSVFADSRGCGITDPVISENFRPTVLRLKATQSAETTLYGDASVSIFVNPNDVGMVSQPDNNQGTGEFNVVFLPLDRFTITGDQSVALNFAYLTNEEFVVKATEKSAPFGQLCWITDTVYLHVEGSYRFSVGYHDSVCLNSDFPLNAIHTGGEPTTYLQRWFKLDSEGTPVEISQHIEVTQPITTLGDMHFWAVGSSWLRTGVGPLETAPGERFFDTIPFTVKSIDSIIARIETVESVRIIGNRVDVARELYPIFDSVLLGEKLRITGVVERRPAGYPHFLFEWDAAEISDSASEFAGFSPEPGDTNVAFTGLIFSPQMFYFAVHDTTAYGCFSMDSVLIGVRQLTGNKNDFVEIPGAFTPHNQDGINDIFMKNVDEITIFNRWGVVIFEAKGPEAQKGWDGRYPKTGRMVDKGDYFYIITIYEHNDKTKKSTKTGVVTVI
jgi:gliding motility-associated-like protein